MHEKKRGFKKASNYHHDIIGAITSSLGFLLDTRGAQHAQGEYEKLVRTIQSRGRQGKDIRYAARELNLLSRDARKRGDKGIAEIASRYAKQLPSPISDREVSDEVLLYPQDKVKTGLDDFVSSISLDERKFYGKKTTNGAVLVAKEHYSVSEERIDPKYLLEVVALFEREVAQDLVVHLGISPETLLTRYDFSKVDSRTFLTPSNQSLRLEGITRGTVSPPSDKIGRQIIYSTEGLVVYGQKKL